MPIFPTQDYKPKWLYRNGHRGTVLPYFTKKVNFQFTRKRVTTPDDDFLDFDWHIAQGNTKLAVLCHGLEGSSDSLYIKGLAMRLRELGWDILAWHYRSCSGEMNRQLRMYHSGATDDLDFVVDSVEQDYDQISLVGFSLGGNLVLKYAGEESNNLHQKIKHVIAVSAPIHLSSCSHGFNVPINFVYRERFLKSLRAKAREKYEQYPNQIDIEKLNQVKTLIDFDEYFTGPVHGFSGAEDYYSKSSALQFLPNLDRATLLINAHDDPFLSDLCFPRKLAKSSDHFYLAETKHGGHVWFGGNGSDNYWVEDKIVQFLREYPMY